MSWDRVKAWRDRLRRIQVADAQLEIPDASLKAAWDIALDAWTDEAFERIAHDGLQAYPNVGLVTARTVPTALMEWCAVLLGRGSSLTVKHPRGHPGLVPLLSQEAQAVGLPFHVTDQPDRLGAQDLVISMGSDASVQAISEALPATTPHLSFGHRFSFAWVTKQDTWAPLAQDLALHDGRGCMTPVVVFVQGGLDQACHGLLEALERVGHRWPRGPTTPLEYARTRARACLANSTTGLALEGHTSSVHGLTSAHFEPESLPRCPAVIAVQDIRELQSVLLPWQRWLSTASTDRPLDEAALRQTGVHRVCALGHMQRPPLSRLHDGIDWIARTGIRQP